MTHRYEDIAGSTALTVRMRRKGLWAVPAIGLVLFCVVAGVWALFGLTRGVEHLGGDQHLILAVVLKDAQPDLFPRDLVFARTDFVDRYVPVYTNFLSWAYHRTGDLATGYRLLVFPVTLVYLIGAYLVFSYVSGSRWVAVGLAIFSSFPNQIPLANEIFGVGPLRLLVARTVVIGLFPLLLFAFGMFLEYPRRLFLLFLGIGLLANCYPVSAFYVVLMLASTYVLLNKASMRSWLSAATLGGAALLGASPIAWSQLQAAMDRARHAPAIGDMAVRQLAVERLGYVSYPPQTLAFLPPLVVHILTMGLLAAVLLSVAFSVRREGNGAGRALLLLALAGVAYLVFPGAHLLTVTAVAFYLLSEGRPACAKERICMFFCLSVFLITITELLLFWLGPLNQPALYVVLTRGSQFAIFGLFMLVALFVRNMNWPRVNRYARVACIVLVLVTTFWQIRHTVRTYLRTRGDDVTADLVAVAQWARKATAPSDLFLFDSAAFRVIARRSLVFSSKDVGPVLIDRPDQAAAWLERERAVRAAGSDVDALVRVGKQYGAQFTVVRLSSVPLDGRADVPYSNKSYAVVSIAREGR